MRMSSFPGTRAILGFALFIGTVAAGLLTAGHYGIASDVGNYFEDSLKQLNWFRELAHGLLALDPGAALSRDVVFEHWRWWPERIPHPPLSRLLNGLGYALFGSILEPLVAYRVAVLVTYGLLVSGAALFVSWARRSSVAGLATGLTLLTVPALFAYGHLANTDMYLTAFWFGSVASLEVHLRTANDRWLWSSAMLAGAAIATKFSGLLLLPILVAWLLLNRIWKPRAFLVLGSGALLVFVLVNPLLWVAPITGISDYLFAGLGRSEDPMAQITTFYFGQIYAYRPPWHYPLVWTAIVVPVPILAAALVGMAGWPVRRLVGLAAMNLAVLYGVLLLPATPLHDGVRLFLPVFPFAAILVGLGVERVALWAFTLARRRTALTGDFVAALVLVAVFAVPGLRTLEYHPHQLSYFNFLIGGIQGAQTRGLEVTNQKEVMSPAVLGDLAEKVPAGSVVDPGFFLEEICFYRATGYAPLDWIVEAGIDHAVASNSRTRVCLSPDRTVPTVVARPPREPDFLFVLNRPGQQTTLARLLTRSGEGSFYEIRVQTVPLFQVFQLRESGEP